MEPSESTGASREAPSRASTIARAALVLAFVIASVYVFVAWGDELRGFFGDPERVRTWIHGFGAAGPLVSLALSIGQVIVAPIPGQFVGLVNGFLFGTYPSRMRGLPSADVAAELSGGGALGQLRVVRCRALKGAGAQP